MKALDLTFLLITNANVTLVQGHRSLATRKEAIGY